MSTFQVKFQLVDSPVDKSQDGGTCRAHGMVDAFRAFPFASEVGRAASLESPTFPTISFTRVSDGEEVAIWTDDAQAFDLCFVKGGKKWFSNSKPGDQVEAILTRFATESVEKISPPSIWRRIFG